MTEANLIEIFSSAQGEGKYLGCRQIFVRFAECNLNCAYCDTNFNRTKFCSVETPASSMNFYSVENPIFSADFSELIKKISEEHPIHSVSFTGGEPLLNWKFIGEVSKSLRENGLKIFLETNGTLFDELQKILDAIDIISMDIKLPSATGRNLFAAQEKFLQVAKEKDLYVKIVVSEETPDEEFFSAVDLIAKVSPKILLIIQPVTPVGEIRAASAKKILDFQAAALKKLDDVRIIPQTHKIINLL